MSTPIARRAYSRPHARTFDWHKVENLSLNLLLIDLSEL